MNFARKAVLGVGLSLLAALVTSLPSLALTAIPTKSLEDSFLLITMYQRDVSGLRLVQLYNDGETPIDLEEWKITNESGTALSFAGETGKWLAPNSHVIASLPGVVDAASLGMDTLSFGSPAKLVVVPPDDSGIKRTEYELKAAGLSVWRRTPTTTGYSSSTSSFTAFNETELFDDGLYEIPMLPKIEINELYPYASDCTPHDESVLCGDYIKLYNPSSQSVRLDDYILRTDSSSAHRTNANTILLDGVEIQAGGYKTVWLTNDDTRLNLTNSGGYIWIEDKWGLKVYESTTVEYESAGANEQGYAWMRQDSGQWVWTTTPQPMGKNVLTVRASATTTAECPEGKYRNPETNRCRTIEEAANALAVCAEGQYRNLATNRCRSSATFAAVSLTPCKEGQERNPATNRCRSIASAVAELMPCDEGYERNPATNRCRKVVGGAALPAAGIATVPGAKGSLGWVLWLSALGVVGYGVYEWRSEIRKGFTNLGAKLGRK